VEPALVSHFVEHFDHHDPRLGRDPDELFDAMVRQCPVAHSDQHGGFWVVSGYDETKFILQNPELFTSEQSVRVPKGEETPPLPPIEIDPPRHARFRSILAPSFSPRSIKALDAGIRDLTVTLIDRFIGNKRCELVADLAAPLPTGIFTQIMGLPIEDAEQFYAWKNVINHESRTDNDPDAAGRATREASTRCPWCETK
jgi:cytochrome P450